LVLGIIFGLVKSSKCKRIRKTLSEFLDEGVKLRRQYANGKEPPSEKEVKDWITSIEKYLAEHCGKDYVSRFCNDAGLGTEGVYSGSGNLLDVNRGLARLNEFIGDFRD
jgi:hypothetical protein